MAEIVSAKDAGIVEYAARLLSEGKLVCYPTDTVYGLGAAASNDDAVRRVYEIKGRSLDKAVPLLISDAEDAAQIAEAPAGAVRLMEVFWPGPLTLVMRRKAGFRSVALAGGDTVALRVPDHEVVRKIIAWAGEPLVGTSANRSGARTPVSAREVAMEFGEAVHLVIDGGARSGGKGSTVLDITVVPYRVAREGVLSREELSEVSGSKIE